MNQVAILYIKSEKQRRPILSTNIYTPAPLLRCYHKFKLTRKSIAMKMEKDDQMRRGPWTEQEDSQLVFYVNLFGDRRWDFIAKVSGLKRTGKSCRLRWVNYLHPGLKRGKMTPHEERLVLQLHSKWGNSWSRIAQKLPGRTDNEIKNYWRTHMRKKAHEQHKKSTSPTSSISLSSSSSSSSSPTVTESSDRSFFDTGGIGEKQVDMELEKGRVYSMDEIWKSIEFPEEICNFPAQEMACDYYYPIEPLWSVDEEENKLMSM